MADICNKCATKYKLKSDNITDLCEQCGEVIKARFKLGRLVFILLLIWQVVVFFIK